jgi:hypothetical protein
MSSICAVCLEDFSADRRPYAIECRHVFCLGCLGTLKTEKCAKCPCCKRKTKLIKMIVNEPFSGSFAPLHPATCNLLPAPRYRVQIFQTMALAEVATNRPIGDRSNPIVIGNESAPAVNRVNADGSIPIVIDESVPEPVENHFISGGQLNPIIINDEDDDEVLRLRELRSNELRQLRRLHQRLRRELERVRERAELARERRHNNLRAAWAARIYRETKIIGKRLPPRI